MSDKQRLLRFSHQAMATYFEVIIDDDDETYARQAAQEVFAEVDRLETLLTRFRPSSDLSQVNRLKPGESVIVTPDLFECLSIAQEMYEKTGGAFDPTVGSLMKLLRGEKRQTPEVTDEQRSKALAQVGMKRIQLDRSRVTVTLAPSQGSSPDVSVGLDLGGIGKGYALDKGAEILQDWGIERALLHAGTSTAVSIGAPRTSAPGLERKGWLLGTGGEWREAVGFGAVVLENQALSGSSTRVRGEHVLDPRTGYPARSHLAAWAIAPSGAVADALSTAFMVMSTSEVFHLCESMPGVGGLVILPRQGIIGAFAEEAIATPYFQQLAATISATDS
ncbi:MAG TPA: FAD:protein FMN transferase [Acidobacteriota bacterium]|nr:FAD:protein FMN transferase [Acidobacteriota bacterium]